MKRKVAKTVKINVTKTVKIDVTRDEFFSGKVFHSVKVDPRIKEFYQYQFNVEGGFVQRNINHPHGFHEYIAQPAEKDYTTRKDGIVVFATGPFDALVYVELIFSKP